MDVESFRGALDARGGEAEVWVVCIEDANETRLAVGAVLVTMVRVDGAWRRASVVSIPDTPPAK
jgi:hypothetical protein